MVVSYKDLEVYKKAYSLTKLVYSFAAGYPKEEIYGLTSQIKRAGLSVVLDIAESYSRKQNINDLKRYLTMAIGSADELNVLIDLSRDLGYLNEDGYAQLYAMCNDCRKMLISMKEKWRR